MRIISLRGILLGITGLVFFWSTGMLTYYCFNYYTEDREYRELRDIAQAGGELHSQYPLPAKLDFNYHALKSINEDFKAWLIVDGTNISYPVVQGSDNTYYLRHSFYKKKSKSGSIFLDYLNADNFSDTNTMIYGHNMKDSSMFRQLDKFEDQDFFERNKFIYIATENTIFVYEILAFCDTFASPDYYQPGILGTAEVEKYLGSLGQAAQQIRQVEITEKDHILTLVTCSYTANNTRIFLIAKLQEKIKKAR